MYANLTSLLLHVSCTLHDSIIAARIANMHGPWPHFEAYNLPLAARSDHEFMIIINCCM